MNRVKTLLKSSVSLVIISSPVLAQPILDPLPLEQTREKVTLRVTRAGFFSAGEAYQDFHAIQTWASGPQSGRKSFVVRYDTKSAADVAKVTDAPPGSAEYNNAHTQRNAATTARLFSPSGELLQPSGGASEPGGQQQLQWVSVDPHWDHVTLEVLALDPAAPIDASGQFSEVITFKDVPLPRRLDTATPVGATVETKHGTSVTMEDIMMHAEQNAQGETTGYMELSLRCQPPATAPDMQVSAEFSGLVDPDGQPLPVPGYGNSGDGKGGIKLQINVLPPARLKNITIKVRVKQNAPSLRQTKHYRRFRTNLKLPPDALTVPPGPSLPTVKSAGGATAQGALEKPVSMGETGRVHGWLWLRDEAAPDVKAPEWFLQNLIARDGEGKDVTVTWDKWRRLRGPTDDERIAWRMDGAPALPGENCHAFSVDWGNGPRPEKLKLEATVAAMLHQKYAASFSNLPLPAAGETAEINLARTDKNGGKVILRRVQRFTKLADLPGINPEVRPHLPSGEGLAVIFEVMPALQDPQMTGRATVAEDDEGRPLKYPEHGNIIMLDTNALQPLAAQKPATKGHWWTVLLQAPVIEAQKLRVGIAVEELLPTGQQATLVFPDALSAAAPK